MRKTVRKTMIKNINEEGILNRWSNSDRDGKIFIDIKVQYYYLIKEKNFGIMNKLLLIK